MVGRFRTPSLGDSISVALRKLLQGGMRGSLAIYKFATKGAGHLNIRTQVSELRNLAFTARRSNQSILKEISPGCSLEGMMLKLKLQYFGHLM